MPEYIDKSRLILCLNDWMLSNAPVEAGDDTTRADTILDAIKMVEDSPAIDAVPVVHGEWIAENNRPKSSMFYCSICHRTCNDIQPIRKEGWKKRCRYAYCPNCGSRMDGGADNG